MERGSPTPAPAYRPPAPSAETRREGGGVAAIVGPLLIVASVLWALRAFVVDRLSTDSDVVTFWLPMFTDLGRSLGDGHIPAWTPYALAGQPLAADPHSGWMQVLPMALFTVLTPGVAIAWLVALQPAIGGLGLYAFLRAEGASRPAATVGGLVLGFMLASTQLSVVVRFPGILAWTAVSLAAAARMARARTPGARIGWLVLLAASWGQAVAIHVSVGAGIATLFLAGYLVVAALRARSAGEAWWRLAAMGGLVLAALAAVNLAVIVPRAALVPGTSIAEGYDAISARSLQLTGIVSPQYPARGLTPEWPVNFAAVPGIYLGAFVLSLAFAGWWSRRWRPLVASVSAVGLLSYVLSLERVAAFVHARLGSIPLVDQYLHQPEWLSFAVLLCVAILAAVGLEALREATTLGRRLLIVGPPAAAWLLLALLEDARPPTLLPFLVGAAVLVLAAGAMWRRAVQSLVPLVVLAELVAPFVIHADLEWRQRIPEVGDFPKLLSVNLPAYVDLNEYTTPQRIARALEGSRARFLSLAPTDDGVPVRPVRALQNNEGQLFGLESAGGYRSLQPERTWTLLRFMHHERIRYNRATVHTPNPRWMDLMGIGWLISRTRPAGTDPEPVVTDGRWMLFRRTTPPPRVSVVGGWDVVPGPKEALEAVLARRFEDTGFAVVEADPALEGERGAGPPGTAGRATYHPEGTQAAAVEVVADRPAMLVIRNAYDPGWSATVDGRPAPVLPANYVIQAVPVPAGRHVVRLAYDDPSIGIGLAGSAAALVALGLVAAVPAFWRGRRPAAAESTGSLRQR